MNKESETPRTDALMPDQGHKRTMFEHIEAMEAHSRQLERELNAAMAANRLTNEKKSKKKPLRHKGFRTSVNFIAKYACQFTRNYCIVSAPRGTTNTPNHENEQRKHHQSIFLSY